MERAYCCTCNQLVQYKVVSKILKEYKGCEVNVIENIGVCLKCNKELYVKDLEADNLIRLYDKYRELNSMVTPVEIKILRKKFNVSQRELVSILGWGKMTINRYEKGALADRSHNDMLRIIIEDENIFFEKVNDAYKSGRLTKKRYEELMSFDKNEENLYRTILKKQLSHEEDIYNGFRKFDYDKTENLISYISDKLGGIYLTSLNKLLFYIDLLNFRENVRSITGLRYMRYTFGPVIENHNYRILTMIDSKYRAEEREIDEKTAVLIKSCGNYDLNVFDEKEMIVINKVVDFFKGYSAKRISECSHKEDAWLKNKDNELISYEYADTLICF